MLVTFLEVVGGEAAPGYRERGEDSGGVEAVANGAGGEISPDSGRLRRRRRGAGFVDAADGQGRSGLRSLPRVAGRSSQNLRRVTGFKRLRSHIRGERIKRDGRAGLQILAVQASGRVRRCAEVRENGAGDIGQASVDGVSLVRTRPPLVRSRRCSPNGQCWVVVVVVRIATVGRGVVHVQFVPVGRWGPTQC